MNWNQLKSEIKDIASGLEADVQAEVNQFIDNSLAKAQANIELHAGSPDFQRIMRNVELQIATDGATALLRVDAASARAVNQIIFASIRTIVAVAATT